MKTIFTLKLNKEYGMDNKTIAPFVIAWGEEFTHLGLMDGYLLLKQAFDDAEEKISLDMAKHYKPAPSEHPMIETEYENALSDVRLLQRMTASFISRSSTYKRAAAIVQKRESWKSMTKRDGSRFTSFEEFVEHPLPDGLGCNYAFFQKLCALKD